MVLILKQRQRVRFGALKAVVKHSPCLKPLQTHDSILQQACL